MLGVIRAFAQRDAGVGARLKDQWNPGIDAPAVRGRADSGDIEIDLVELLSDVGGLAADRASGVAVFIDEMQDLGPDDVSALCAACHEISQSGLPLIVVGAGLPHLPAVLCASKSYSERLFRYQRIDRLPRDRRRPRPQCPRRGRGRRLVEPTRSRRCTPPPAATPTSSRPTARPSGTARPPRRSRPPTSRVAAPEAEAELAVGFFGSRYDRATPGERDYLRAMADVAAEAPAGGDQPATSRRSVPTADVATPSARSRSRSRPPATRC